MIYFVSKLVGLIFLPSTLVLILLGLGIICLSRERWQAWGFRLVVSSFILLAVAGFTPLGNWVILPLENRFASVKLPGPNSDIAGIIILGGFEDGWVSAGRPGLAVNEAAERLTEGVRIARQYPQAKVVFTGGVGGFLAGGLDAADPVARYIKESGISSHRIVLEANARNTFQNATFTKKILHPKQDQMWILVTSAYHMPRAIGVFRKAGFRVVAAATDYRTRDLQDMARFFERISAGLERVDLAVREWIGLVAYWVAGRTSALMPAPENP